MSFNVNGIKSFTKYIKEEFKVSFNDYLLNILNVDILCLQEVKCIKKDMAEFSSLKDYITFTNLNQHRNGIYGVSTVISKRLYCRKHNIQVPYSEYGRSLLTDHKDFKILNLYCPFYDPNGSKTKESVIKFYQDIYNFIREYDDMIVLGDFNAVYSIFDHYVFYNEFVKIYKRKNDTQEHALEILNTYPDPFTHPDSGINYERVLRRHDDITGVRSCINQKLCKIFGKDISRFLVPTKSPYLGFLYDSLYYLKNINFTLSEGGIDADDAVKGDVDGDYGERDDVDGDYGERDDVDGDYGECDVKKYVLGDDDIDFKMDLIEKSFHSATELPYLVDNAPSLVLLLYSTFQRKWMLRFILEMTHIDTFRLFHTGSEKYTCWNTQLNLRPVNLGSRIDYILVPIKFFNRIQYSDILEGVYGSDHCPVYVNLNLEVENDKDNICRVRNNILSYLKKK